MSEDRREPITGELRRAMVEGNYRFDGHHIVREELAVGRERFYGLCDAIDAVHAALEDESAGLRERLAKLDKRDDYMHDGWVELPKDANGETIRIGDVMETLMRGYEGERCEVEYMTLTDKGWDVDGDAPTSMRHHHAPTVEDVLREMLCTWEDTPTSEGADGIIAEYSAKLRLAEGDAE